MDYVRNPCRLGCPVHRIVHTAARFKQEKEERLTGKSEYKEFFDERFRQKKSIRKYAADHNLNRGSVNYMQKMFYNAFAEQLDARDKAEKVCRIQKPAEKKKSK